MATIQETGQAPGQAPGSPIVPQSPEPAPPYQPPPDPDLDPAKTVITVTDEPIQQQLVKWSNEYATTPEQILRDNNITDTSEIVPGQELTIAAAELSEEEGGLVARLISGYDPAEDQPVEDYSEGVYKAPGIDVSLKGEGDLDTRERDFTGDIVTETRPGTYKVDITKGEDEGVISEAAELPGGVTKVPGVGELALAAPSLHIGEEVPSITGTEKASIPEGTVTAPVSTTPTAEVTLAETAQTPTEAEIIKLIESARPSTEIAADVFDGVIDNIKEIEHESTFDAKAFYKEISEEAERETKKIDDSIAEIAEEKIKPTFSGWNKFMAVLGAAMGAYGSAMTGTPNYALQIINRAIDADQEQFLASKEIRTKSLLQQRLAVIQRKADLLQMGINEADRMLQVAELQIKKEESIASVKAIKDGLVQAKEKEINDFKMKVIEMLSTKAAARKLSEKAEEKDFRERGIEPVTLKDGKGNLIEMPGYLAKTAKEGAELRKTSGFGHDIQDILNKLDTLSDETGKLPKSALLPAAISETRTKVAALANELIIKLKDFYGMGANFTEYEQTLIQALTPTDDWLEKWKMWKVKSNNLRDTIVRTHKSMAAAQGAKFAQMPNAANKKKLGPGMKVGVSE